MPDAGTPVLELRQVTKSFRTGSAETPVLENVDLQLSAGEVVAITGTSGSGKSTLLHLAGGLQPVDAGTVRIGGADWAAMDARRRATVRRRAVGFVFQAFHLLPGLTVAENVAVPFALDGRRVERADILGLLDSVGIRDKADHRPGQLSGGEMQRAAIARALIAGPGLVLADEPTGNLDTATSSRVLDLLLAQVTGTDTALLVVTHDDHVAARAGRVLELRGGKLR